MNHTYLALTIGPITKTIHKARSTRGLWGSSFLISYLMRVICRNLVEQHGRAADFITPYVSDKRLFDPQDGAGLFPDQLIFRYREGDEKRLNDAICSAIKSIYLSSNGRTLTAIQEQGRYQVKRKESAANPLFDDANREQLDTTLYTYFCQYFLFRAVKLSVLTNKNVVVEAKKVLGALELQQPLPNDEVVDWLSLLLQNVNETHLPSIAYSNRDTRFPSLIEIATSRYRNPRAVLPAKPDLQERNLSNLAEIYQTVVDTDRKNARNNFKKVIEGTASKEDKKKEVSEEDGLLTDLRLLLEQHKLDLRQADKYIAIVSADGDNMGTSLQTIFEATKTMKSLEPVSKALLDFNIEAIQLIRSAGGRAVYLGGDDLVFFAPLLTANPEQPTVFHLVEALSECFDKHIHKVIPKQAGPLPSLSFGVSLSYYKYPLFEAREVAESLLYKAKDNKAVAPKNAVAFQLLKHSGHLMEAIVPKSGTSYKDYFLKLLATPIRDGNFLSSVMHRLQDSRAILEAILTRNPETIDGERLSLKAFFSKQFNELLHQESYKPFLQTTQDFIQAVYKEQQAFEPTLKLVYATLRLIQFLHLTERDDD